MFIEGEINSEKLFEKFGYVEIPIDYTLYSKQKVKWKIPDYEIFTTLDKNHWIGDNDNVSYKLKITKPIKLISLYCLQQTSRTQYDGISLIRELLNNLEDENSNFDIEECKYFNEVGLFKSNWKNRESFINALKQIGIDGWVLPTENNCNVLECCLFTPSNCIQIEDILNNNKNNCKQNIDDMYYKIDIETIKGSLVVDYPYSMPNGRLKLMCCCSECGSKT
jgi:hypothetical protein